MQTVVADKGRVITIGKQGENLVTRVLFPLVEECKSKFGDGSFELLYKRPKESDSYAVVISADNINVAWDVTSLDLEKPGFGRCQLCYLVDENRVAVSEEYVVRVYSSLFYTEKEPPEPWETWINDILNAGTDAKQAASKALESAEKTEGYANSAQTAANSAQTVANSAQTAANSAQTAANSAQTAARAAQAAAETVHPNVLYTASSPLEVNTIYNLGCVWSTGERIDIVLPKGNYGDCIQVDFGIEPSGNIPTISVSSAYGITDFDLKPTDDSAYSILFDWGLIGYEGANYGGALGWRISYAEYKGTDNNYGEDPGYDYE